MRARTLEGCCFGLFFLQKPYCQSGKPFPPIDSSENELQKSPRFCSWLCYGSSRRNTRKEEGFMHILNESIPSVALCCSVAQELRSRAPNHEFKSQHWSLASPLQNTISQQHLCQMGRIIDLCHSTLKRITDLRFLLHATWLAIISYHFSKRNKKSVVNNKSPKI